MNNVATSALGAVAAQGLKTGRTTDFDIVDETLAMANSIATRVECLADALLGVAPTPPAGLGNSISESPSGVLPRMAGRAHYARGRLGDAMAALERIERSLPA